MATFVIVHGAWSGAHAWRWVRPLLRAAGHDVVTPSLTGLGERAHLATPATNLDTHITDIAAVLHYEDLHDVVLVGHSYGGMVITGVADRVPERIGHLVYLDADVPREGESDAGPRARRRTGRLRGGGAHPRRRVAGAATLPRPPAARGSRPRSCGRSRGWCRTPWPR